MTINIRRSHSFFLFIRYIGEIYFFIFFVFLILTCTRYEVRLDGCGRLTDFVLLLLYVRSLVALHVVQLPPGEVQEGATKERAKSNGNKKRKKKTQQSKKIIIMFIIFSPPLSR